jgi:hypothetical protein
MKTLKNTKLIFLNIFQADLIPEIKAGLIDFKAVVATMLQSEARVSILRLSKFEVNKFVSLK